MFKKIKIFILLLLPLRVFAFDFINHFEKNINAWQQEKILNNSIKTKVFESNDQRFSYSPGHAYFNWNDQICLIGVNSELANEYFVDSWSRRYFVYHELMHCRLYSKKINFFDDTDLDNNTKNIINDFFYVELFKNTTNKRMQINGFWHFHEAYADLMSLALMYNQNMPKVILEHFLNLRKENFYDQVHAFNLNTDDFEEIKNKDIAYIEKWAKNKIKNILILFWHNTYAFNQEADFIDIMKNNAVGFRFAYLNSKRYGYDLSEEERENFEINILPIVNGKNKTYDIFYAITKNWRDQTLIDRNDYWQKITNQLYGKIDDKETNKKINKFFLK